MQCLLLNSAAMLMGSYVFFAFREPCVHGNDPLNIGVAGVFALWTPWGELGDRPFGIWAKIAPA